MLGVFVTNVYIGLYDSNLSSYNPVHYDLNWIIAAVDIVAALLLFLKSKNLNLVVLSGIVWPLVYLAALGGDVATSLCLGTPANPNCWPTAYDAFKYLILGDKSEGWVLWQYTIPTAILFLIIVIVLSLVTVLGLMHERSLKQKVPPADDKKK